MNLPERPVELGRPGRARRASRASRTSGNAIADLGEHVRVLRPLAGEQERDRLRRGSVRLLGEVDAARVGDASVRPSASDVERRVELLLQVVERRRRRRRASAARPRPGSIATRDAARSARLRRRPGGQGVAALLHAPRPAPPRSGRRQTNSSAGQCRRPRRRPVEVVAGVLLEHGVEVRAAEAEGADPGGPRVVGPVDPRPGLGVQVERAAVEVRLRVRRLDQRRRQHLVVQGERRLDEPGQPGGALAVADHRLDRARGRTTAAPPPASRNTWPSARASVWSPTTVPVPWASTSPTRAGETPAWA